MNIQQSWEKALKHTEIIRSRVSSLLTHKETLVPYLLLSESTINVGDTVVRKGEVLVERPKLILPPNIPQLEGFELEGEDEGTWEDQSVVNFLLLRGVTIPSLKYNNKTHSLDIFEGKLSKAIDHFNHQLQYAENVNMGLITGPEDCWQFSLLIFICSQIAKNAEIDIRRLLEEYKRGRFS